MKTDKFCCGVDQIDICSQIVSELQKNGIRFVWQLIVLNEQVLALTIGCCNTRLIRYELSNFLEGCDVEGLINLVESFLERKINEFPKIYSLVDPCLREKKIIYLFNQNLSEAKKNLIDLINQEVVELSN